MQAEETQKSTSFSEISLNFLIAQTLVIVCASYKRRSA